MSTARRLAASALALLLAQRLTAQESSRALVGAQRFLRAGEYHAAIDVARAVVRREAPRPNPHHFHLLAFAATMAGRSATAITAARDAARRVAPEEAERDPELQIVAAYPHLTLATFGRWSDVLRAPMPDARLRVATALAWHARGTAFVRTGRLADAAAARDTIRAVAQRELRWPIASVVRIAQRLLDAELCAARDDRLEAMHLVLEAKELEDSLGDIGLPYWPQPTRQLLGAALLAAGRAGDAEPLYRQDLARYPDNVWSLAGLARTYDALGRRAAARATRARLAQVAERADVTVRGSRF